MDVCAEYKEYLSGRANKETDCIIVDFCQKCKCPWWLEYKKLIDGGDGMCGLGFKIAKK